MLSQVSSVFGLDLVPARVTRCCLDAAPQVLQQVERRGAVLVPQAVQQVGRQGTVRIYCSHRHLGVAPVPLVMIRLAGAKCLVGVVLKHFRVRSLKAFQLLLRRVPPSVIQEWCKFGDIALVVLVVGVGIDSGG